ncbi:MAG: hypothetical protein PW791_12340 [Neorhizobium sp.]|nr:hypothetical protein [Neorhizobium sp.]
MSIGRRIISGTIANTAGIAMNALLQIASVPILLSAWGAESFGIWVMLTTIPTYFALTDLGFLQATTSEMAMLVARDEKRRATRVFFSASAFILCVTSAIFAVAALLAVGAAASDILPFGVDLRVLLLLAAFSALSLFSRLPVAALRATGHYAAGTLAYDAVSVAEGFCGLLVAALGGGFADVALSFLIVRLLNIVTLYVLLHRSVSWLRLDNTRPGNPWPNNPELQNGASGAGGEVGPVTVRAPSAGSGGDIASHDGKGKSASAPAWKSAVDIVEIRALARPALAAMTIPLALALNLQGVVLIVGALLSPAAVAVYGPVRTCSRLLIQLVGVVNRATMPELSRARAGARADDLKRIVKVNRLLLLLVLLPGSALFAVIGREVVMLWSAGHIVPDRTFVLLVALATLVHGTWYFLSNMLLATNDHMALAKYSLAASLLTLGLVALFARAAGLGGVGLALLIGEGVCAIAVWRIFVSHYRQVLRWT